MALTDAEWATRKKAVQEYSLYRPYLLYMSFIPVANQKQQVPPTNTFGIESIDYGEQFTLAELYAAGESDTGWCFHNGQLLLTPAPKDTTAIKIVWRQLHAPDEISRTHPTVPTRDSHIVDWLVEAVAAEASATPVELGLSGYTIGGTTVRWAQSGGGGSPNSASRAARFRERAQAALSEPMASWG